MRLQTQTDGAYTGALDCVRKTAAQEGLRAFYKGTVMPLLGVGACVSIQFASFEAMRRVFHAYNGGGNLSMGQFFVAGAAAGIANSPFITPIEHVRIRKADVRALNLLRWR